MMLRLSWTDIRDCWDEGPVPTLIIEGMPVGVVQRDNRTRLVVDHRPDGVNGPCRVEYWECLFDGEGRVDGVYVLCAAAGA